MIFKGGYRISQEQTYFIQRGFKTSVLNIPILYNYIIAITQTKLVHYYEYI